MSGSAKRSAGGGGRSGGVRRMAGALGLALVLAALLVARPAVPAFYTDPPALAARVALGELPEAGRRLPVNPLLLQVEDAIGRYGGTWPMALIGGQDGLLIYRTLGNEPLVRWDTGWKRVIPNIAQAVESSADATRFTFHLRPGLRWSDGHPFTAADILFWFEDVASEPELAGLVQRWRQMGALPARVVALDAHKVRFEFDRPNSLFLIYLAVGQVERGPTDYPRHALARYHRRHNPDGLAAEMAAAGVSTWTELFALKAQASRSGSDPVALLRRPLDDPSRTVEAERVPTLEPWVIDRLEPGSPPRLVAERNPYYWKVDPAGQQLPYIDRLEFALVATQDDALALARDGRIGMQARHFSGLLRRDPRLAAELQGRGYRMLPLLNAETNTLPVMLNLTHRDPVLRAVFGRREFRVALSVAIDRRAVIDAVFQGKGEPYQIAPRPESRFHRPEIARQHLGFDPAAANRALDALGLERRDAEGYRLLPDGRRLAFTILARRDWATHAAALDLIARQWRGIGVELTTQVLDRREVLAKVRDNAFDAVVGHPEGGLDAILDAFAYMPLTPDTYFAPGWVRWLENPGDPLALEPPGPALEQVRLYERIRGTADPAAQDALMHEILAIFGREFYVFGVGLPDNRQGIVRNDFRNVPKVMFEAWQYPSPAPTNPAQYFIEAP